jgi:hypothetical protein
VYFFFRANFHKSKKQITAYTNLAQFTGGKCRRQGASNVPPMVILEHVNKFVERVVRKWWRLQTNKPFRQQNIIEVSND